MFDISEEPSLQSKVKKVKKAKLKLVILLGHVDRPGKLLPLRLVVDLLNGNAPLLTPGQRR